MTSSTPVTTTRSFKIHPNIIQSVMKKQAGSVEKAITELVLNSIDAGATEVYVKINQQEYSVVDNGKGIQSINDIHEFFAAFGRPHEEGDAVFGQFRMGRGQSFVFSRNYWRTGPFNIDVDIKNNPDGFDIETDLPVHAGCHIRGVFYTPLTTQQLVICRQNLSEFCRYSPVDIYVNGELISSKAELEQWTQITEDAYIRVTPNNRSLTIYNLGIKVMSVSAYTHGFGGEIVSRKRLALNSARNDILKSKCKTWKAIRKTISVYSENDLEGKKMTDPLRHVLGQKLVAFLAEKQAGNELRDYIDLRILTTIAGKHVSLDSLYGSWTVGDRNDARAQQLHASGVIKVFDRDIFEDRFCKTDDFISLLNDFPKKNVAMFHYFASRYTPIDQLLSNMSDSYRMVESSELTNEELFAMMAINSTRFIRKQVFVIESETLNHASLNSNRALINRKFLSGAEGPSSGMVWAMKVAMMILHEGRHKDSSVHPHGHDLEMLSNLSDDIVNRAADFANYLLKNWVSVMTADRIGKVLKERTVRH